MLGKKQNYWLVASILTLLTVTPLKAWSEEITDIPAIIVNAGTLAAHSLENQLPTMTVRRIDDAGEASLMVGLTEVLKIKSTAGGLSPAERVAIIQDRLMQQLNDGKSGRDIKPGLEGKNVVVRIGDAILVTVDPETAEKSSLTTRQLAFQWANLLRKSLGADPLERDPNLIASRGFSPVLDNLRETGAVFKGFASWYGPGFHGRRCANGERFDMHALTAAHRTLPLGSMVKVTNAWTGKSAIVRINDRGPFIRGRIIDLSKGAAQAVGMLSSGTAPVVVEVLGR